MCVVKVDARDGGGGGAPEGGGYEAATNCQRDPFSSFLSYRCSIFSLGVLRLGGKTKTETGYSHKYNYTSKRANPPRRVTLDQHR